MKLTTHRKTIMLFSMLLTIGLAPTTASASKSAIHFDLPGFSIGYHSHHSSYRNKRHYKKHRNRHRFNRRYYRHHNRYYYHPHYSDPYYYDHRYYYRPRSNYYGNIYRQPVCPIAGFSLTFYDDRDCYKHKDHFHCDG